MEQPDAHSNQGDPIDALCASFNSNISFTPTLAFKTPIRRPARRVTALEGDQLQDIDHDIDQDTPTLFMPDLNPAEDAEHSQGEGRHHADENEAGNTMATKPEGLGSVVRLAPVHSSKVLKEQLGNNMVLTPVRRSARQPALKSSCPTPELLVHAAAQPSRKTPAAAPDQVRALLEATSFCYTPNKALLATTLTDDDDDDQQSKEGESRS